METTAWTQKALEALNMAGLIEPGCVNLRGTPYSVAVDMARCGDCAPWWRSRARSTSTQ